MWPCNVIVLIKIKLIKNKIKWRDSDINGVFKMDAFWNVHLLKVPNKNIKEKDTPPDI